LGVVERAREVAGVLEAEDAELLIAAAYGHDVGYAPELVRTGFHPLDGARFVRDHGFERLAGLVAYHCASEAEAAERGLLSELREFEDDRSLVSRALVYCDLGTDPDGQPTTPMDRLKEIRERYDATGPEVRALEASWSTLSDEVRVVDALLGGGREVVQARANRRS
jgi:hypothetical protein